MNSLSFDKKEIQARQYDSHAQVSERTFHLIFSCTLIWGFLLNIVMVSQLQIPILRMMLTEADSFSTMMIVFLIAYFALCFLGSRLLRAESTVTNFVGFNLIALPIGVLLSIALTAYVYQPGLVYHALLLTMGITLLMMALSMAFPQFFSGLGRILGVSLLSVLVVELISLIFFPRFFSVTDYIVAGLMCLYIGFDWWRVTTCPRTPQLAIAMAANLYLDIVNLFLRILSILSKRRD